MAKAKKPDAGSQTTEIISDAIGDVVTEGATPSEAPKTAKFVIDVVGYDATNLSDPAKGAVASLQFAEAKIMALQNELAICQTAHFAYVKGLKADLEGKAS